MVEKRTVIIYPHIGQKAGTGHIKRLLPFFYDSRFNTYICNRDKEFSFSVLDKFSIDRDKFIPLSDLKNINESVDLIILDNRESDRYLYDRLKDVAPIVAIDEGGAARDFVTYTLDILPNLLDSKPNYYNPGLLDLPIKSREIAKLKRILITFGGQDPYGLTKKCVDILKDRYDITTVIGPMFSEREFGVNRIENQNSLKEILGEYDLIITTFGLTAYEAESAGVPVALLNPTDYHQKLGLKAGFYCLDDRIKINYQKIKKATDKIHIGERESLTDFIYNLELSDNGCPLCSRKNSPSTYRFINKSYYWCNHCLIDYMSVNTNSVTYGEEYFFRDYKKQYGKTYLEDFDSIKVMGESRLSIISKKLKRGDRIFDIGCAYGPFLKACDETGYKPYGLDISSEAISYVRDKLGYDVVNSQFPSENPLDFQTPFNCVTMWYVIEHFLKLDQVLTQVNRLLDKGGVFAFSTPNLNGISGKKDPENFYKNSPDDHFTLWSAKSVKKVLKHYGFKVYKIRVTGHHPERFNKIFNKGFLYKALNFVSRLFKLGDTFEVYAIKDSSI